MFVRMCVSVFVQRLEHHDVCPFLSLSVLSLETGSLTESGARLAAISSSALAALGLRV